MESLFLKTLNRRLDCICQARMNRCEFDRRRTTITSGGAKVNFLGIEVKIWVKELAVRPRRAIQLN